MFSIIVTVTVWITSVQSMTNFADVSCGKQASRHGKIVGGDDADLHEFPWIVSITRRGGHFCGGTLITNQHVLTAAHCICIGIDDERIQPGSLKLSIAQHDLTNTNSQTYEVPASKILVHPEYSCRKAKNDVAVIELASKISWSDIVGPACLPQLGSDATKLAESLATVAGWGWTAEIGKRASKLQKAKVNIVDNETCQTWFKSQGKKTKIQEGQICAGHEQGGIDSCWADSGGPLMVHSEGRMVVVGVVSTGIGCARPHLPGLYTRVGNYMDWIKSAISS